MKRAAAGAGLVLLVLGALLARTLEPGVAMSRVELSTGPALRIAPVGSATRPTALLGHGVTASKETLICLGEALAASGFECLLIDFPGHGESRTPFGGDVPAVLVEGARALTGTKRVDVIAGHSMGAYVAAHALEQRRVEAKLLLAFGAAPHVACETVYLIGAWEELVLPPRGAVVSPWSDHCTEPWDPVLVDAAVSAACASLEGGRGGPVGAPPHGSGVGLAPARVSHWKLRALGGLLVLVAVVLLLAALTPERGGALTGLGVAALALLWPAVGLPYFFAGAPTRAHLVLQVPVALVFALGSLLLHRLAKKPARLTQGALALLGVPLALSQLLVGNSFGALMATLATAVIGLGWALGSFAESRTRSPAAAHAAFGLWLGYLFGQWCPLPF